MPIARFQLEDGRVARFEVPDGTTPEQAQSMMQAHFAPPVEAQKPTHQPTGFVDTFKAGLENNPRAKAILNAVGGIAGGAGAVGNTLLLPVDAAMDYAKGRPLMESNNKYRNKLEDTLKGMGADTGSLSYQLPKIATEIAATAPVGGGLGTIAKELGATRLGTALQTGGMKTGAPLAAMDTIAGIGSRLGDLGLRVLGGAGTTAAGATLLNPNDTEKGAKIGAALPVAMSGLGHTGSLFGGMLNAVSDKFAKNTALKKLADSVGETTESLLSKIKSYEGDIPLSMAGMTQNPKIAALEVGNRARNPANWYEFDKAQADAVYNKMLSSTKDAEDLTSRAVQRSQNWKANWANEVEKNVNPEVFAKKIPEFQSKIDQALRSPEAVNENVRNMLLKIKSTIDDFGADFSPAHLQQIRADLSGKYQPMSSSAFASAPRSSPATQSVLREVDDILNQTTGGAWSKVPAAYKADSELLHQAKAASKVRSAFIDQDTGRILVNTKEGIPEITSKSITSSMNAAREPLTKNLKLSPEANQGLTDTLEAMRMQNILQNVKKSGTAGGGSDTIVNSFLSASPAGTVSKSVLRDALRGVGEQSTAKVDRQLMEMLSNPENTALLLSELLKRPQKAEGFIKQIPYYTAPAIAAQ